MVKVTEPILRSIIYVVDFYEHTSEYMLSLISARGDINTLRAEYRSSDNQSPDTWQVAGVPGGLVGYPRAY